MLDRLIAFILGAVKMGIPLLYGCTGEILTEKSGNLNMGIPGIMYIGSISGVIGSFLYEKSLDNPADINPFLAVFIPLACCLFGAGLMGLLYCFLTVTLRANQNVTGLAMTTFGIGLGNFFGGSLIRLVDGNTGENISVKMTSDIFRTPLPCSAGRASACSCVLSARMRRQRTRWASTLPAISMLRRWWAA